MLSHFSHVRLCETPWTIAYQAPLFMGFSRQEYCSVLPFPSPGDLPNPGIKPASFMSPALAGGFFTTNATWEALSILVHWFLKCQCSLLLSSVWPHALYFDSWTEHSRFLCNIALESIRFYFHHQPHPQLGIVSKNFQICKLDLEKAVEPEIKLPASVGS